jgi:RNA polymerase sigma factor (sigma-70 family)
MHKTGSVTPLIENLFRRESGRLTAALTRFFGSKHVELAEDVVQDTLIKAMHEWPFKGIPDDPVAWLHRVAKNGVIDRLRRDTRGLELIKEHTPLLRSEWTLTATVHEALDPQVIADDQLRMMFACCHPSLPPDQQVALVLKTLCGFSVPEIARAFLTNEETINKRLHRARTAFRELGRLDIPQGHELPPRLEQVLQAIYLLFNEGYHSITHAELIREDLIEEALRLNHMLLAHEPLAIPEVHALHALMCFHTSRTASRKGEQGSVLLLHQQDRSKWDRELIALGNYHLDRSANGASITTWHMEAAIASLYANPLRYEETDWAAIVSLYDALYRAKPGPLILINRAIALCRAEGASIALSQLEAVQGIADHNLYYAARGDLLLELDRADEARASYERALELTASEGETRLIQAKLTKLRIG